jgi:ketol-acid reductoisomerase
MYYYYYYQIESFCNVSLKGMDWMYAVCSTTARRGALDWAPEFHKATKPVFEVSTIAYSCTINTDIFMIQRLYESVENGSETRRTLEENARPDYRERLEAELKAIRESEMWQAGKTVRGLRPENQPDVVEDATVAKSCSQ